MRPENIETELIVLFHRKGDYPFKGLLSYIDWNSGCRLAPHLMKSENVFNAYLFFGRKAIGSKTFLIITFSDKLKPEYIGEKTGRLISSLGVKDVCINYDTLDPDMYELMKPLISNRFTGIIRAV